MCGDHQVPVSNRTVLVKVTQTKPSSTQHPTPAVLVHPPGVPHHCCLVPGEALRHREAGQRVAGVVEIAALAGLVRQTAARVLQAVAQLLLECRDYPWYLLCTISVRQEITSWYDVSRLL